MNLRMTLTAVALASVALAGCGSLGGDKMSTPVMAKPVVTAPAAATIPNAGEIVGDPLLQEQGTETMESRTGFGNPSVIKRVEGGRTGDPLLQDQSTGTLDSQYDVQEVISRTATRTIDTDPLLQNQGRESLQSGVAIGNAVTDNTMMTKPTVGGDTMMDDKMMADKMSADDAVMNACFQAGGQVVSWVGDSTGATQACRREDGLEYRLADAQYYQ